MLRLRGLLDMPYVPDALIGAIVPSHQQVCVDIYECLPLHCVLQK
jgi:hypothetical protein